jgi:hypothetical protein
MPIDWNALPGLPTPVGNGPVPLHFGSLIEELTAVSDESLNSLAVTDLAWINCTGDDARAFLHNQLTSDVNHLEPDSWQHSAWCSAKGRMLANLILVRLDNNSFALGLPEELAQATAKRLKMFVLRSDVSLEACVDTVATVVLSGPDSARLVKSVAGLASQQMGNVVRLAGGWAIRQAPERWLIATPIGQLQVLKELLQHARPLGLAAWHLMEVRSGVPIIRQRTQDEFVPQMLNFEQVGGVSFHKGCYPGQEVIARTQYLGKVKRHLYRVRSAQELSPGQVLFPASHSIESPGACGTVASAAPRPDGGWEGLAVILETSTGIPIHAGTPDGPVLFNIDLVAA